MKAGSAELAQTLANVVETVDSMNSVDIGEHEFRTTYLPLVLAIHSGQHPQMHGWAYRTGSIYNGFRVISDSTGEVLYTTPGLHVQNELVIEGGFTPMLQDVGDAQKSKMPTDRVYAEHLNADKAKLHLTDSSEHLLNWYRIFARYGYKMARVDGSSTLEDNAPKKEAPKVDWGNDEFA